MRIGGPSSSDLFSYESRLGAQSHAIQLARAHDAPPPALVRRPANRLWDLHSSEFAILEGIALLILITGKWIGIRRG
jgi:hypothetical protein